MAGSDAPIGGESPATSQARGRRPSGRGRDKTAPRPRRVPERTCIACRQVAGKRALVRVVRTTLGGVEVDLTGRKNGRGAYLHADTACWDLALRRNALNVALKVVVGNEDLAAIRAYRDQIAGAGVEATPADSSSQGNERADTPATT